LNTIVGTYECKVDAKGRVLLPAPLSQLTLLFKTVLFETFCFSALFGIVSNGRMEFNDAKNQQL
jgi:DNA-binding transcriptional regulator/RsmH inhibitor MraZ